MRSFCGAVKIGVVGKYVHLRDSYKSLHEALGSLLRAAEAGGATGVLTYHALDAARLING